jgi:type IX secretion system PorP/SprF family membrane protein
MMIRTIYLFVTLVFLLLLSKISNAQHDPMFSQYMFNIQSFNPAYAGSWKSMGFTILAREQWSDFDNHPSTQTLTLQAPINNNRTGIGFSLINDNIGRESRKALFIDYSFGISFTNNLTLRLGLKGGVTNYSNNYASYTLIDKDDPLFLTDFSNQNLPNFGVGAFLHSDRFYLGFSIPKILQNEIGDHSNTLEVNYFTFIGGIVYPLSRGIDMKPSFNVRYCTNAPVVTDLNLNFLFVDKFWIGALFRITDELELGFNTHFLINDRIRVGYAYDLIRNSGLSSYGGGTHEIMLTYEFRFEKTHFTSPRYF